MAARNPLVLISGAIQELPAGDTVNGGSGGGGAAPQQAIITLPYSAGGMSTVNVVKAGVTTASIILASLTGTVENEADDIDDWEVTTTPQTGSIDFNISCPGPFCGQVAINYMIG